MVKFLLITTILTILFISISCRSIHNPKINRDLIDEGAKWSQIISAKLATPWFVMGKGTHTVADAIPSAIGLKNTTAGTIIAAPLHLVASTVTGTSTALTGFLVSVPIATTAGLAQSTVEIGRLVQNTGSAIYNLGSSSVADEAVKKPTNGEEGEEEEPVTRAPLMSSVTNIASKIVLKPLAVIFGAKGALTGYESMWLGKSLESIGHRIFNFGKGLEVDGKEIKGTGATIFKWGSNERIPLIASADDLYAAFNFTRRLPPSIVRYLLGDKADYVLPAEDEDEEEEPEPEGEDEEKGDEEKGNEENLEEENDNGNKVEKEDGEEEETNKKNKNKEHKKERKHQRRFNSNDYYTLQGYFYPPPNS